MFNDFSKICELEQLSIYSVKVNIIAFKEILVAQLC